VKIHLPKPGKLLTHLWGRLSGRYYFEDFVRVYPDGVRFNRHGVRKPTSPHDLKNFLNHAKFYAFAAQFVRGAAVADIGCGSGYGCAILKNAGAARISGADASEKAIAFAQEHYGTLAEFSVQGITNLKLYAEGMFDVAISSEVLEHVKEYRKEDEAVREVKRVTRPGGVILFGTPNLELSVDHGFSFEEIDSLMRRHFTQYCLFENALLPFGPSRVLWEQRLAAGRTGVIVTQAINLAETVLPDGATPELKGGIAAGIYRLGSLEIDTRLLHNTHSWAVVAMKTPV
jgi:2-polyprenyl-3-methyl-5-hydroxy-6-metoxy-1,4-benzoquinol methylase